MHQCRCVGLGTDIMWVVNKYCRNRNCQCCYTVVWSLAFIPFVWKWNSRWNEIWSHSYGVAVIHEVLCSVVCMVMVENVIVAKQSTTKPSACIHILHWNPGLAMMFTLSSLESTRHPLVPIVTKNYNDSRFSVVCIGILYMRMQC